MQIFFKKVLIVGMVVNIFAFEDCFSSDGWYDHDYDHHDYDHHHDHDYDHHSHGGWWGGGHLEDIVDDFGERYDDSENSRRVVTDKYAERINASRLRHSAELTLWRDEYSQNQSLIGIMTRQFHEQARGSRGAEIDIWSHFFNESIENGDLVFFKSPDSTSRTGISITLLSKEQVRVVGDWTQHTALVIQYANKTDGQCLFVHLTSKDQKKRQEEKTWFGYSHMQQVEGIRMVLDQLVLPSGTQETVPYSPFMTWWIEPTELGWKRAYDAYQELLTNKGNKDCSYRLGGASYISRKGLSAWLFGRGKYWEGAHNCVTYCSMILEKFGVIAETDLMRDKLSLGSSKTQLARSLIMSDSSLGILLSRGEEDFQEEGANVHPWVTMNVGRIIKKEIEEQGET